MNFILKDFCQVGLFKHMLVEEATALGQHSALVTAKI